MLFSKAAGYGIRATAYLAAQPPERLCGAREIAEREHIPPVFLRKILGELRRHRILHSVKGIHGGYQLARPAAGITLWELVQLLDHGADGSNCFLTAQQCDGQTSCPLDKHLLVLRRQVIELLQAKTVSQLATFSCQACERYQA